MIGIGLGLYTGCKGQTIQKDIYYIFQKSKSYKAGHYDVVKYILIHQFWVHRPYYTPVC